MTNEEQIRKLQEIRTQALADGDQTALYEADRELSYLAEYREHYNRRWAERPTADEMI